MLKEITRRLNAPTLHAIARLTDTLAAVHRTAEDRQRRGVVAIEVSRELAETVTDWSMPIQVRFSRTPDGNWTMECRSCVAEGHEAAGAARAARQ